MSKQCCETCKWFDESKRYPAAGHCLWAASENRDLPDWVVIAVEECVNDKENWTATHMGTTCKAYEEGRDHE